MKIKVPFILFLGICIAGLCITKPLPVMSQAPAERAAVSSTVKGNLKILNSTSQVKHGGAGFITIKGRPRTRYYIRTSYRLANRTILVTQWRITDGTGVAVFNWIVSTDTVPGTYTATITGDGETLRTNHTVLP